MPRKRVSYYYDSDVGAYSYGATHCMKPHRMRITHELVIAYNMTDKMRVLRPSRATPEMMTKFHTDEYVHFLTRVTPETVQDLTYDGTRFLVGDDNPPFEGLFEFCSISAGGSLAAAQSLATNAADIAINWAGGLHHAKKREASGFCYINDIVLGILELLRTYPRVLYIDIDCHHGDGVEEAFYITNRVMTCSFHKFGDYFPGTGTQEDRGKDKGKGYSVNVPLKDGLTDESFKSVFEPVVEKILEVFRPSVIVLQCGADSLAGDKLGCFNVTMKGHANCVQFLRNRGIPLMLLGGGGYTVKNVARTWAYETACALDIEDQIDLHLPWNEYFEWFGPRYRLEVAENNMDDLNVKDGSIERIRKLALKQLSELEHAPSVQMQDVPRQSLHEHLGLSTTGLDEEEETDEIDERLAQHTRLVYKQQEADTSEDSDVDDGGFAEHSQQDGYVHRRRRARERPKRMSILTNQFFEDLPDPCFDSGAPAAATRPGAKRRFFQGAAQWDEVYDPRAVILGTDGVGAGVVGGGRGGESVLYDAAHRHGGLLLPGMSVDEIMEGVLTDGGEAVWNPDRFNESGGNDIANRGEAFANGVGDHGHSDMEEV